MLEEVEVPQPLEHHLMDRILRRRLRMGEAAAEGKVDVNAQRAGLLIELHALHVPRRGNSKGRLKQRMVHRDSPPLR